MGLMPVAHVGTSPVFSWRVLCVFTFQSRATHAIPFRGVAGGVSSQKTAQHKGAIPSGIPAIPIIIIFYSIVSTYRVWWKTRTLKVLSIFCKGVAPHFYGLTKPYNRYHTLFYAKRCDISLLRLNQAIKTVSHLFLTFLSSKSVATHPSPNHSGYGSLVGCVDNLLTRVPCSGIMWVWLA